MMDETSNQSAPTGSPLHNNEIDEIPIDTLNDDTLTLQPNNITLNDTNTVEPTAETPENSTTAIIKKEPQIEPKEVPPTISKPKPKSVPKPNHSVEARKAVNTESSAYTAIQEMLKEEGASKWDRNVSQQIQEFMFQVTTQMLDHAKNASEHRESTHVNMEDVNEAVESFNSVFNADRVEYGQRLHEISEKLNSEPLPKIRSECGLHTPNERFMIVQPDYRTNENLQKQIRMDPMVKTSHTLASGPLRHPQTNMYSTSVVEQSFNNLADDPSEFD